MRKLADIYLVFIISINMLLSLTIVCAPHSSMMAIESLLSNPKQFTQENDVIQTNNIKQIELLGQTSGSIEFNR